MPEKERIRVSDEFMDVLYEYKARCYANGIKAPSNPEITKIIAKNVDSERIFQKQYETNKI